MVLTSARLQNYRSYSDSSFEFEPGINIIVGPNASGKTNLLDALYLALVGAPIRTGNDYLIKTNQEWARVDILTDSNQKRIVKIKPNNRPEFLLDDNKFKRLSFNNTIPVVLFEPNHLFQITTSPEQRRSFIDEVLIKTDPEFLRLKSNYTKTLRQRNGLLKKSLTEIKKQIFAWDLRLCESAGGYVKKRLELIELINKESNLVYSSIAGKNHTQNLVYDSKIKLNNYSSNLLKTLQTKLELDFSRGFTGYGPHRDDILINIDEYDMRNVASRGETRSILLSLKIIEARLLEKVHSKKPILLLDDVFGELDGARRKSLIEFISGSQTFITTTDADIVTHDFINGAIILTTL